MARYSKLYSNYLLKKRHQNVNDGVIFERDWGTLGERHVIESGKKRVYTDSNFLFTDNDRPGLKKRYNTGDWSDPTTLDDLSISVNSDVNAIRLSDSIDLRDYAYYGSALEYIRATIENIVKWFPGMVYTTKTGVYRLVNNTNRMFIKKIVSDGKHNYAVVYINEEDVNVCEEDTTESITSESVVSFRDAATANNCVEFSDSEHADDPCNQECLNIDIFLIYNPFDINLYDKNSMLLSYENRMRNMPLSWGQYLFNGDKITSYNVWIKPYDECDKDYTVQYDITITHGKNDDVDHIYGIKLGKETIWCSTKMNMVIKPYPTLIEEYFNGLDGLESVLLNRSVYPNYTASFLTPIRLSNEEVRYVKKNYTWPSTNYCIEVDSILYSDYISSLYTLGEDLDELWCDNIWRNMTHESIKNFDWTYTREYNDGDEEENILGGTRMQEMLRIYGRCYDDLKRYIDGISLANCVTYDGHMNMPNALLSDKVQLHGWEYYSTKPSVTENDNLSLGWSILVNTTKLTPSWIDGDKSCVRFLGDSSEESEFAPILQNPVWYPSIDPNHLTQNDVDIDFARKLLLSTTRIFQTKGTKQGIDMVFGLFGIGDDDYTIEEKYYSVTPKPSDDPYYYYKEKFTDIVTTEYELITDYYSLKDYVESLDDIANGYEHVAFESEDGTIYYDKVETTVSEFAQYANTEKGITLNYTDDAFSGIPLADITINKKHYIVPYFTQDRIYDGDVQLETNGGWGKNIKSTVEDDARSSYDILDIYDYKDEKYNYMETIPYMEVMQYCSGLTNVNLYKVGGKEVYYVIDLSDYTEYNESVPSNLSHFFKLVDKLNPQLFTSWKNIPFYVPIIIDGETTMIDAETAHDEYGFDYDEYCSNIIAFDGVYYDDYLNAKYHDKIMQDNIGNNPHVGYGKYDLGTQYLEYIKKPFKYALDNYTVNDQDLEFAMSKFTFDVTEYSDDKIVNNVNADENTYYLPSKVLVIKNNVDSDTYRDYFNEIILPYLTQVIPSTSIFILKDF